MGNNPIVGGFFMEYKKIFDTSEKNCVSSIRDTLTSYIKPVIEASRPIIILCIGTDRSTGDCLGPLVGEKLKFLERNNIFVYGNLQNPVHSKNLVETISQIKSKHKSAYILAIDACLGSVQNIGKIVIQNKPLSPGAAMNKDLPQVGDISITGIVNISGGLEFMVLQNTRLFTVMQLADMISQGIYHSILKTLGGKRNTVNII